MALSRSLAVFVEYCTTNTLFDVLTISCPSSTECEFLCQCPVMHKDFSFVLMCFMLTFDLNQAIVPGTL